MSTNNHYIPGVCNIGPAEIKKRRALGWGAGAVTIALFPLFHGLGASPAIRLLIFLPALLAANGFLQAQLHFCVGFGFAALFRVDDNAKVDSVIQAEFRAIDRKRAIQIVSYSFVIGLAVAALAYFLG
jgi:hypothetical protein